MNWVVNVTKSVQYKLSSMAVALPVVEVSVSPRKFNILMWCVATSIVVRVELDRRLIVDVVDLEAPSVEIELLTVIIVESVVTAIAIAHDVDTRSEKVLQDNVKSCMVVAFTFEVRII